MRHPNGRILVFAKAPVPGQVKTRLARRYGGLGAARLYRTMLWQTLGRVSSAQLAPTELWCAPDSRHRFFALSRRRFGVCLHRQIGADLGARMNSALVSALRRADYAILIGADCPSLDAEQLRCALDLLAAGDDAVLGPAEDGGYVLIGLRRPAPGLFRGIAWGGSAVAKLTRRRLQQAGLRWSELALGWDIDYPQDVRRWRRASRARL